MIIIKKNIILNKFYKNNQNNNEIIWLIDFKLKY